MPVLRRRDTLSHQVLEAMRERIANGDFKSGEKLPSEQELIEEFGVSRTVVREAIASLKAMGIVSTQQGVGAFVVQLSESPAFQIERASLDIIHEAVSVLEVRISLETEAAYLAAERRSASDIEAMKAALRDMEVSIAENGDAVQADLDFHSAIARATGNKHFLSLFSYLGTLLIPRTRLQTFQLQTSSREDYLRRILREHAIIFQAIEGQEPDHARDAMRSHLGSSRDRLIASSRKRGSN
ncbi:FadR/GntR family transcriptional regulator [Flaviflagellibacter deserti]|uniref:FadR/GntR family transcriptional regulator n=1 Tax=Flaviflagellibacter deserti TaxID=2267266 RepID=A0ABV9YWV3_9HYPH